ncbi:hypothetical protein B2J88_17620 [Rhodococcus sp. SRB_17]|nr:hypothetical protein [Rhodococcus sp. SRB_17]
MSRISDLVDAYSGELSLPWRSGLSGGERVWMLVYPPDLERTVRAGRWRWTAENYLAVQPIAPSPRP